MKRQVTTLIAMAVTLLWVSNSSAQICQPSMGTGATTPAPASPTTTVPQAPAATSAGFTNSFVPIRRSASQFGAQSSTDAYLQALGAMNPMNMFQNLGLQQPAVQNNQARLAARRAMREPARARLREQNAYRLYEAGVRAESNGQPAAAARYYRRAVKIDPGSQAGQDAQAAIAELR